MTPEMTYCGGAYKTKRDAHSYWCNAIDGACPQCLRAHIARLEASLAYKQTMLDGCESEIRHREKIDKVQRTRITILEAEGARVVPELAESDLDHSCGVELSPMQGPDAIVYGCRMSRRTGFRAGYALAAARLSTVPASRVLKDGEVAVSAEELVALRELFTVCGNTIHARSGGLPVTLAEINDAWAGVCAALVMQRDALRAQPTEERKGEG